MGKQLSPEQRARALGLLDAGTSQQVVARRFRVHRATIRRLQKRDSGGDPVWRRKSGTGMKKSYGVKEITAIRKAIEKNPFMTSYQIKLRQKRVLKNISLRTIRRILLEDLGRHAVVAKKKPFLSEVHKREAGPEQTPLEEKQQVSDQGSYVD